MSLHYKRNEDGVIQGDNRGVDLIFGSRRDDIINGEAGKANIGWLGKGDDVAVIDYANKDSYHYYDAGEGREEETAQESIVEASSAGQEEAKVATVKLMFTVNDSGEASGDTLILRFDSLDEYEEYIDGRDLEGALSALKEQLANGERVDIEESLGFNANIKNFENIAFVVMEEPDSGSGAQDDDLDVVLESATGAFALKLLKNDDDPTITNITEIAGQTVNGFGNATFTVTGSYIPDGETEAVSVQASFSYADTVKLSDTLSFETIENIPSGVRVTFEFSYTVNTGDSATVSLVVEGENSAPEFEASNYVFNVSQNGATDFVGAVQALDPDGDSLGYALQQTSIFTIAPNGNIVIADQDALDDGDRAFNLEASAFDSTGAQDIATLQINVVDAVDDDFTATEVGVEQVGVLFGGRAGNDFNISSIASLTMNGQSINFDEKTTIIDKNGDAVLDIQIDSKGALAYTALKASPDSIVLEYVGLSTLTDANGKPLNDSAKITFNLPEEQDPPVAENDSLKARFDDRGFVINSSAELLMNDEGVGLELYSVSIGGETSPYEGGFSIPFTIEGDRGTEISWTLSNAIDGNIQFSPSEIQTPLQSGETAEVTFSYIAKDEYGQQSNAGNVTLTLEGRDATPVFSTVSLALSEDAVLAADIGDTLLVTGNILATDAEGEVTYSVRENATYNYLISETSNGNAELSIIVNDELQQQISDGTTHLEVSLIATDTAGNQANASPGIEVFRATEKKLVTISEGDDERSVNLLHVDGLGGEITDAKFVFADGSGNAELTLEGGLNELDGGLNITLERDGTLTWSAKAGYFVYRATTDLGYVEYTAVSNEFGIEDTGTAAVSVEGTQGNAPTLTTSDWLTDLDPGEFAERVLISATDLGDIIDDADSHLLSYELQFAGGSAGFDLDDFALRLGEDFDDSIGPTDQTPTLMFTPTDPVAEGDQYSINLVVTDEDGGLAVIFIDGFTPT